MTSLFSRLFGPWVRELDRGALRFRGTPAELCARHAETSLERAFIRCIHGA